MIASFPPYINDDAAVLILGTMPGAMSLFKQEYYAHKQNAFWKIMYTLYGELPVPDDFEAKKKLLKQNNIALWDVLKNCEREGSLDTNIKNHVENDIEGLLAQYPNIRKILFNGKESYKYFQRKFGTIENVGIVVLPSTSPANTIKFEKKLEAWREALDR
jgi:hypoxanthine-DNA glycosylase